MMLTKRFVASEIKAVVFAMHLNKSPGPNIMNAGFFQAYWDIVREEVSEACLDVLNNSSVPPAWNEIHLVLRKNPFRRRWQI